MTSYRPVDSKREEFRKYLEKAGALDALSKVLCMLYDEPEKPSDALDYIRKHLGAYKPDEAELHVLKSDLEEARLKIQTLEDELKLLKERLAQYESAENAGMVEGEYPVPEVSEGAQEGEGAHSTNEGPESAAHPSVANASATGSQPAPQ